MLPVVGVRDKNLEVQGYLDFGSCELRVFARFNSVGAWELSIPVEHPLADLVRAPGSGVVCFLNGRVISGWTRSAVVTGSASDPQGSWVVRGVTDEVLLAARETYPNPALAASVQDADYYVDSGVFESVAKSLVDVNLGGGALVARRLVSVATDLGRGSGVKISTRFKNVLEELQSLAVTGGMGFHVFQDDDELVFDVYSPVDRSREIQLDVQNGGLASSGWGYEAPSVTRPLVAGQGSGADRTIVEVSTPESDAAAVEWGFSIERFKDQRNTDDNAELTQSGLEMLTEGGLTGRVISMEPSGSPALKPGVAYWLGDTITVASSAGVAQAQVTEILFSVTAREGLTELITVGDPVGFNFESRMGAKVEQQDRRISQLERSAEGGGGIPTPTTAGTVLTVNSSLSAEWANPDYRVVANITERDAIPSPKGGMRVWVQSESKEYVWIGSSWRLAPGHAVFTSGSSNITAGNTILTLTLTGLKAGQQVRVDAIVGVSLAGVGAIATQLRYTENGSAPSVSSPLLGISRVYSPSSGVVVTSNPWGYHTMSADGTFRVSLFSAGTSYGAEGYSMSLETV